jgi:hypothetical protein
LFKIEIGLRRFGFHSVVQAAARPSLSSRLRTEPFEYAERYAHWLDVAGRVHPTRPRCLHRSLALHYWLRSADLPSVLRIGVRKEGHELKAHAWVELDGRPIAEPLDAILAFAPLVTSDGRVPEWNGIALDGLRG